MLTFQQTFFIQYSFVNVLQKQWYLTLDIKLIFKDSLYLFIRDRESFPNVFLYKTLYMDGQLFSNYENKPLPSELFFLKSFILNGPKIYSRFQEWMQKEGEVSRCLSSVKGTINCIDNLNV